MDHDDGSVEALAASFRAGAGLVPDDGGDGAPGHHDHDRDRAHGDQAHGGDTSTSIRRFEHRGHDVCIETTYRVRIDDEPLQGHLEVLPSGAVHYHVFPQYAPQSAVDVVKTVIDTVWDKPDVPDELADPAPEPHDGPDGPDGPHHPGGHGEEGR